MAASNFELYGSGVFTTIAVAGGEPFRWGSHWRRLAANAGAVGIDLSQHSEASTHAALLRAITADHIVDGKARLTFSDERSGSLWPSSEQREQSTRLSILTGARRPLNAVLKLTVSPYTVNSRSPLAGVKSCNYLENLLAMNEAKARGFDEAARVNESGHVASAAMANVFWLKDGVLYTPSLATGCLPGTTREYVLENMDWREIEAGIGELEAADSIFLTSAGLGVTEVSEFGSRQLVPSGHPVKNILPWAS